MDNTLSPDVLALVKAMTSIAPPAKPAALRTSGAIGELADAFALAQGEFVNPGKGREVVVTPKDGGRSYKFKYATFDDITAHVRPILAKHKLSFTQVCSMGDGNRPMVTTRLMLGPQWIESDLLAPVSVGKLQEMGGVFSYLKRYALSGILGLAGDDDDDANGVSGNEAQIRDRAKAEKAPPKEATAPKAEAPAPQAPVDPTTGECSPHRVAYDIKGEKIDWRGWAIKMSGAFRASKSLKELQSWWDCNTSSLETIGEVVPKDKATLQRIYDEEEKRFPVAA